MCHCSVRGSVLYKDVLWLQKQRKMQKERLMNDFSAALNNFQGAQRQAAEKEKASVARARASSGYVRICLYISLSHSALEGLLLLVSVRNIV